ncbi:MAG: hypothetical protein WAN35_02440 [Terracidiphilus sp.]
MIGRVAAHFHHYVCAAYGPCDARIIGTHEHESHFVFDIPHNNKTGIRPDAQFPVLAVFPNALFS